MTGIIKFDLVNFAQHAAQFYFLALILYFVSLLLSATQGFRSEHG